MPCSPFISHRLGFRKRENNAYWISYFILLFKTCQAIFLFSSSNLHNLSLDNAAQSINICMPVCPDYSLNNSANIDIPLWG